MKKSSVSDGGIFYWVGGKGSGGSDRGQPPFHWFDCFYPALSDRWGGTPERFGSGTGEGGSFEAREVPASTVNVLSRPPDMNPQRRKMRDPLDFSIFAKSCQIVVGFSTGWVLGSWLIEVWRWGW